MYKTAESVTEGHPDKICDQIADAILDEILSRDRKAAVAVEVMAGVGFILVGGEVTTKTWVDIQEVARRVVEEVGYTKPAYGFEAKTLAILNTIHEQSPDISRGVFKKARKQESKKAQEVGAGDQGIMYGYATDETKEFLPLPVVLAHRLAKRLAEVRKKGILRYLRPDGKTQVTVEYQNPKSKRIEAVVVAAQHDPDVSMAKLRRDIKKFVIEPVCKKWLDRKTKYFINNTGRFVIGGPVSDTGCTGRKAMVDTYGGLARHGGGSFSGKDPSKVDRSAAYMARYVAKNVVAARLAKECEISLSYVIGGLQPLSISLSTFGTGKVSDEKILTAVKKVFDFSPSEIIKTLDLLRPIYREVASYGHFGRPELKLPWERIDRAKTLKKLIGLL